MLRRRPSSDGSGSGRDLDRPNFHEAPGSWQESYAWLSQMGWNVDDRAVRLPNGQLHWTVIGTDGDRSIEVTAPTRTQAWLLAHQEVRLPIRPGGEYNAPASLN